MRVFDPKSPTLSILSVSLGVSLLSCLALPVLPAAIMHPFFLVLGQGGVGFTGSLFSMQLDRFDLGLMVAYCVPALLGLASLWFASRLDFDSPADDHVRNIVLLALVYLFVALTIGFLAGRQTPFIVLAINVLVGIPVTLTLPFISFGIFIAGLVSSPSAYKHLTAQYDLKRRFAEGKIVSEAGLSDLQRRLLARRAPPDAMVEDAERFRVESTVSDLMIEVEQLRTEIRILTEHRTRR
jgi:hypothetical protein